MFEYSSESSECLLRPYPRSFLCRFANMSVSKQSKHVQTKPYITLHNLSMKSMSWFCTLYALIHILRACGPSRCSRTKVTQSSSLDLNKKDNTSCACWNNLKHTATFSAVDRLGRFTENSNASLTMMHILPCSANAEFLAKDDVSWIYELCNVLCRQPSSVHVFLWGVPPIVLSTCKKSTDVLMIPHVSSHVLAIKKPCTTEVDNLSLFASKPNFPALASGCAGSAICILGHAKQCDFAKFCLCMSASFMP